MYGIYQTQTKRPKKNKQKMLSVFNAVLHFCKAFNEQDFNEPIKLMAENM